MKVEYVEPFVDAACTVLSQVAGDPVSPGTMALLGSTFPASAINVVARVDGSLRGDVVYSMSSSTAQKLAALIMGAEARGFGRLTGNGLARFGHMLANQTSSRLAELGLDCEISSPTVFQGLNVEFSVVSPALVVPLDTGAGRVEINVAVRNGE